jgi:hypothetical protein
MEQATSSSAMSVFVIPSLSSTTSSASSPFNAVWLNPGEFVDFVLSFASSPEPRQESALLEIFASGENHLGDGGVAASSPPSFSSSEHGQSSSDSTDMLIIAERIQFNIRWSRS